MERPTLRARFKYWFDGLMSHGTGAMLGFLALVVILVVAIDAVVVMALRVEVAGTGEDQGFWAVVWENLIRTLKANDVSPGAAWAVRVSMIIVTIIGVFIVANLIGIVSGAFNAKVAELRKGRSRVLEKNHTVILGWNSKIHSIIAGLCEANASLRRASIVVLANRDKVAMEDEIRDRVPDTGRTRIICRTGTTLDQDDLLIASPFSAKSVIILADESEADPDAKIVKTALALIRHPHRPEGRRLHVVGQIRHSKNLEVARVVGRDEAKWVLAAEKVGQIMAQTSRQPGLSNVYTELLSFHGAEIYFSEQPSLVGTTYSESQMAFADSAVMGVASGGKVGLNPPGETPICEGDKLILLAEDDSLIDVSPSVAPDRSAMAKDVKDKRRPEKTLILGANSGLPHILEELNAYAAKGSSVTVVSEHPVGDLGKYSRLAISVQEGSASNRATLDALDPASFDHVIVVAYRDDLGVQEADTVTLVTLLHLREIMSQSKVPINVVSEMLDERNRRLAEVTRIDDFIVSDNLVSLMMSQVSENPKLSEVFGILFDSAGCEIYLRPVEKYVKTGTEVDFYTVVAAAQRRGETAIGYLEGSGELGQGRVILTPPKAEKRTYAKRDRIIVLAED